MRNSSHRIFPTVSSAIKTSLLWLRRNLRNYFLLAPNAVGMSEAKTSQQLTKTCRKINLTEIIKLNGTKINVLEGLFFEHQWKTFVVNELDRMRFSTFQLMSWGKNRENIFIHLAAGPVHFWASATLAFASITFVTEVPNINRHANIKAQFPH